MFLPISRGWQGFTDFLPLLWHPDMFLLTLPSLPVFLGGGEGISFGSFLGVASPSATLPSCRSQPPVQKGCAAGKAIFTTPQPHCIHLLWDNHELWAHLSPGCSPGCGLMNSHPFDAEYSPRSSCSLLTTVPAFLCSHRMLLQPDSFAVAQHSVCSKPGGSWARGNLIFSFLSPCEVSLLFWEDETSSFEFFKQKFAVQWQKWFTGGLAFNETHTNFWFLNSALQTKYSKVQKRKWFIPVYHSYTLEIWWPFQLSGGSYGSFWKQPMEIAWEGNLVDICGAILIELETTCPKRTGSERAGGCDTPHRAVNIKSLTESIDQSFRTSMAEGLPVIFQRCSNWSSILQLF